MRELPVLGEKIYASLKYLAGMPTEETTERVKIVENICKDIIKELKNQGIADKSINSDFLQDYGPQIQLKIKDEKLRNWSPWLD